MKLIHCADIHLGSAMSSRLPRDKAQLRRSEIRGAFSSMVDYAREEQIPVILLAGDVFDSDRPAKKDKEFFYSVVRNNPQIDFLYLRGNHDQGSAWQEELPNLKTFGSQWSCVPYPEVTVWGLELGAENASTLYASLKADSGGTNIVMLHGQVADAPGEGRVCLQRLREQYIDYLALGHIHSFTLESLDSRGVWCYPGCLEGRGYDECGPKGFAVLDTQDLTHPQFVSVSKRTIHRVEVDITGCEDEYQVIRRVRERLPDSREDLLRLELTGALSWDGADLPQELTAQLEGAYFHVSVKNLTTRSFDLSAYADEVSLAGEFVRQVQAMEGFTPEEKQRIMDLGLRALSGQEVGICG